jgi:TonB family protein
MDLLVRARNALRLAFVVGLPLAVAFPLHAQRRTASIMGTVRDSAGTPLPDVYVSVVGSGIRVRTGDDGAYRIVGILAGPATLNVRRLGSRPYAERLRLEGGEIRVVDVRLGGTVDELAEIRVTEAREVWESRLAGFNARRAQQIGHFVTRERIDRANSSTLTDMLREIPGVRIGPTRGEGRAVRLRGATCPPLVFVDGFPATAGEFDLDIIDLKSVEGIEVYGGSAAIPAELTGPRELDRCGVIAVWSRPSRRRAQSAVADEGDSGRTAPAAEYFTSDQVDDRATLDSGTLEPRYPDSLYQAGVGGQVVVEFVVDSLGLVDPATVDILSSTDDQFSSAVREALAEAHFAAARKRGRRVRQLVQLPVTFALAIKR